MKEEYVVGKVDDIPDGEHVVVEVRGRELGIFNVRGQYYALPNACFHQNGPVCRGAVSGTVISNADTGWKKRGCTTARSSCARGIRSNST